jgi:hypothetical protein
MRNTTENFTPLLSSALSAVFLENAALCLDAICDILSALGKKTPVC